MIEEVKSELQNFDPISLWEMDAVALLNRTDTKFVFSLSTFLSVLPNLRSDYFALEIENKRQADYRTLYFDTPDKRLFTEHQNGKQNRYKVRIRKYVDSNLCFLEVKFKTNKGRTIKKRIPIHDFESALSDESKSFILENSNLNPDKLIPALWNEFSRITLVSKTNQERLTIDTNLQFKSTLSRSLQHLVIAEVKREGKTPSAFIKAIKEKHVSPTGMSKYCVGSVMVNTNLKYNNFKPQSRLINKLENEHFT
jgi:hypothetical protein